MLPACVSPNHLETRFLSTRFLVPMLSILPPVVCLYSVLAVYHFSNIFLFLLSISREKLVTAIWQVKPILKWEIDSIQAVIDEEKEHLQGKVHEITERIFNHEKPSIRSLDVIPEF